jgi:hypothetical protein
MHALDDHARYSRKAKDEKDHDVVFVDETVISLVRWTRLATGFMNPISSTLYLLFSICIIKGSVEIAPCRQ